MLIRGFLVFFLLNTTMLFSQNDVVINSKFRHLRYNNKLSKFRQVNKIDKWENKKKAVNSEEYQPSIQKSDKRSRMISLNSRDVSFLVNFSVEDVVIQRVRPLSSRFRNGRVTSKLW